MRARERRLGFERLEQRKVFAAEMISESSSSPVAETYPSFGSTGTDGVRAAEVRIQFDPLAVQPDLSSIKAGDAWNGKASVVANVDEVAGTVVAFLFTTRPISGQGNLLEVDFKSMENESVDVSSASIGIETVRLNEGEIEITPDLTVFAPPSQSSEEVPQTGEGNENATHYLDGISQDADELALTFGSLDDGTLPEEVSSPDSSDSLAEQCHEPGLDWTNRHEDRNRLHDMQVTSVFIGPMLPDFMEM